MITAYGDDVTKRKALEGGAELLTKPIDFVALRRQPYRKGPVIDFPLVLELTSGMGVRPARRRFPVGTSPTRQPLQPEAIGAVMEVTKWLKRTQHGKPHGVVSDDQPDAREGQVGRLGVAERFAVPLKPGNAGGGKRPYRRKRKGKRCTARSGRTEPAALATVTAPSASPPAAAPPAPAPAKAPAAAKPVTPNAWAEMSPDQRFAHQRAQLDREPSPGEWSEALQ
jgi:hypothetical protein